MKLNLAYGIKNYFLGCLYIFSQGAVGDFDPQRKKLASDNIFPNATDMWSPKMPIIGLGQGEVLNAVI